MSDDFDPLTLYQQARAQAFGGRPGALDRERRDSSQSSVNSQKRKERESLPPPSAFNYNTSPTFPFQAYAGNPDPGMSIPRNGYSSRRSSLESLVQSQSPRLPDPPASPSIEMNKIYRNSVGGALATSVDSATPRNASTSSFRPAHLSPASRASLSRPNSVIWTPPQYPSLDSPTASTSVLAAAGGMPPTKPPLPSTRIATKLTKEDKPWLATPQPRERLSWWITFICVLLGLAAAGAVCWDGYNQASKLMLPGKAGRLCTVLDEDWDIDSGNTWVKETGLGGWGNGEFQIFTDSSENVFIRNGQLYILPTLTSNEIGYDNLFNGTYTVKDCGGSSSSSNNAAVLADTFPILADNGNNDGNNTNSTSSGNSTSGNSTSTGNSTSSSNNTTPAAAAPPSSIPLCQMAASPQLQTSLPPIKSARLTTKGKKTIDASKGGKIEIRAKLGRGDWLLNRIRLMPESPNGVYGQGNYGSWPQSGEVDMLTAKTNRPDYAGQGSNFVHSSLLYGPFPGQMNGPVGNGVLEADLLTRLDGWTQVKQGGFSDDFHTYTLEWTPNFMNFYVDSRIRSSLFLSTDKDSFFKQGKYPQTNMNQSTGHQEVVQNVWSNGGKNAPFDQNFYLAIDVGAGGTNGVFPDNVGEKPWIDGSVSAMSDFAKAQPGWLGTWPTTDDDRAFRLQYVKMWQVC